MGRVRRRVEAVADNEIWEAIRDRKLWHDLLSLQIIPAAREIAQRVVQQRMHELDRAKNRSSLSGIADSIVWEAPPVPESLRDDFVSSAQSELELSKLRGEAAACADALAGTGNGEVLLCADAPLAAVIAGGCGMRHLLGIPVRVEYGFPYAVDQVRHLTLAPNADVVVTIDASVAAGWKQLRSEYRWVSTVHHEMQFAHVPGGDSTALRTLRWLPDSSYEEHGLLLPDCRGWTRYPKDLASMEALKSDVAGGRGLEPGDGVIVGSMTMDLMDMKRKPVDGVSGSASRKFAYKPILSLYVHRRWFDNGRLKTPMHRFLDLYWLVMAWLRKDQIMSGSLAGSLLRRNDESAGFDAANYLRHVRYSSSLDADSGPRPLAYSRSTHLEGRRPVEDALWRLLDSPDREKVKERLQSLYALYKRGSVNRAAEALKSPAGKEPDRRTVRRHIEQFAVMLRHQGVPLGENDLRIVAEAPDSSGPGPLAGVLGPWIESHPGLVFPDGALPSHTRSDK